MEDATLDGVLKRMMQATNAQREADLARVLEIAQQALYSAKKKGALSPAWVMKMATEYDVSLDRLFFSRGSMHYKEQQEQTDGQTHSISVELTPTLAGMQARIKILEEELAAAKEGEKIVMAEALKAHKLATEAMRRSDCNTSKSISGCS